MAPCWGSYEFARSGFLLLDCTAREATSLPYSFVAVLWEFAQPVSSFWACTARAAGSRPYAGWAIVVAWDAETLPGTAQESQITHRPGAHWGEAPCASNYNLMDKQA